MCLSLLALSLSRGHLSWAISTLSSCFCSFLSHPVLSASSCSSHFSGATGLHRGEKEPAQITKRTSGVCRSQWQPICLRAHPRALAAAVVSLRTLGQHTLPGSSLLPHPQLPTYPDHLSSCHASALSPSPISQSPRGCRKPS